MKKLFLFLKAFVTGKEAEIEFTLQWYDLLLGFVGIVYVIYLLCR
jgi:hypothetical protein